jgi:hypothetical protein
MTMRDSCSNVLLKKAIAPQSVSDNTALVSSILDCVDAGEVMFGILTGSIADADATFAVLFEHGDEADLSDHAAVADADLVSQTPGTAPETAAGFQFDDDSEVRKIGYIGTKRYLRVTITPANNASAALVAAFWELRRLRLAPVTQPES